MSTVDTQLSRVARQPVFLPKGVTATISGNKLIVKGKLGELEQKIDDALELQVKDLAAEEKTADREQVIEVKLSPSSAKLKALPKKIKAMAGTTRALVNNLVQGVEKGFSKQLDLVGVGYKAQLKGKNINMQLGFSHPIDYIMPASVTAEIPAPTTIILKGADKQKVGQVAAELRAFRPPEPYKGKGVKYSDEVIVRKEAKKK